MKNERCDILLTAINAKWIHPSLALRLLKANLGRLENYCKIVEFALRQPLQEKLDVLAAVNPRILGISVSIWNHTATLELLKKLKDRSSLNSSLDAVIVLGGPEVSHLPQNAEIFQYADYVIRGEGEIAFKELCENIFAGKCKKEPKFIDAEIVDVSQIKSAYHLYTDEDVTRKLIYVEASRGCLFNCEFCLSSCEKPSFGRDFSLEPFFAQMDVLIKRGVKTFKFLDRTFNVNIKRAIQICEFFLKKYSRVVRQPSGFEQLPLKNTVFGSLDQKTARLVRQPTGLSNKSSEITDTALQNAEKNFKENCGHSLPTVHFEMSPSLFTPALIETLGRFPPGSLRLEIGLQTLNGEAAKRINLPGGKSRYSDSSYELETLRLLCEKTNAIIHADLIAGLPGETLASFGKGFDRLTSVLKGKPALHHRFEIQLGILKQLPGTPISRHNKEFAMHYNPNPPYEIEETSTISAKDMGRIKNFARFWELIVNRNLHNAFSVNSSVFDKFMSLSDTLFAQFGRNWGIDKNDLIKALHLIDLR